MSNALPQSSPLCIRPAVQADFEAVLALYEEVHGFHAAHRPALYAANPSSLLLRERFASLLDSDDDFLSVAVEDGAVCGFIHAVFKDLRGKDYFVPPAKAHIEAVGVAAFMRGRGIGRALLAEAEQWAAAKNASFITLDVQSFNTGAIQTYEQAGFHTSKLRMEKFLSPKV